MMPFFLMAQLSINGKISDLSTNESLPGANIRLLETYFATVSGSSGKFEIKNLQPRNYTLVCSYIGFYNDTIQLNLKQSISIAIELMPAVIMQDEVIVHATRAGINTPIAHENIDKRSISTINFGQDLPILLGNSISAVSTSDAGNGMGYTALRIRGTDMTRINVTINGLPLNDPESHNVFWVDLPDFATSTDNIQIQRGVGTSSNGAAAFGASINLQSTHLKTEPYAEINSAYGSFNTLKNTISFGSGTLNKHFSMDGRISKLSSDGFIDRAYSDLLSYYLSGAYTSKKNLLRFNIISGKEKTYQSWDGIPSEILDTNRTYNGVGSYFDNNGIQKFYKNETDNYIQTHYQAIYAHEFNKKFILNIAAHRTVGKGYYEQYRESDDLSNYGIESIKTNLPFYLLGNDTINLPDSTISQSDLIRQKHLANTFSGLTWSLNHQSKKLQLSFGGSWNMYVGNHFGTVIWSQFAGNSEINHEWYRSKANKKDLNIYAKTEYSTTNKFHSWLDFQLRRISYSIDGIDDDQRNITQNHTFIFFNPKGGFAYDMSEKQKLYASISIANREPNRDNFVDANPSNALPKPERLYDAEAGYSFKSSNITLNINAYFMYYHNQLVLTGAINDVGAPIMINIPVSYRNGIELSAKALIYKNIKWEPSITLSNNKIKSFTEYIDNWDTWEQNSIEHSNTNLAFSPNIITNSTFSWMITKELNVSLISKFVGKQNIDNTQSDERKLDPYFVNNLIANYTLKPNFVNEIGFSLMINNVFNTEYESNAWVYRYIYGDSPQKLDGFFPQAGLNFMIGVNVKL